MHTPDMKAKIVVFSTGSCWVYVRRTIYSFDSILRAKEWCEIMNYRVTVEDA